MKTEHLPTELLTSEADYSYAWFNRAVEGWLLAGECSGWTTKTRDDRRWWMARFADYLQREELHFSAAAIRSWIVALQRGTEHRCRKPLKAGSIEHAMRLLRSFCSWLTQEELTPDNLMRRMPNPIKRESDIHPFEPDELDAVFAAARRTRNGPRDEAALLMLADTGLRSSELCGLSMKDVDLTTGMVHVRRGKGDKARRVPLSPTVRKALWCYLRTEQRHPEDRLFMTERGDAFEHNSLRQLCERLGRTTGIHVHPHRFRHTFAVNLLRAGAQQLHLMEYLGHTSITVTARYVKLAAADLQAVHRTCSPVEWARRQSRRCNA